MHGQRFFQPFLEASGCARIDPFQLPEDFLQRFFGLHVVVHRIGIAHSPVVVFLAVLRQMLPYIPPLMNLAALHFHPLSEDALYTGSQRFRSVDHHQIPPLQIPSAVHHTAAATDCCWRPRTAGSRCSSRPRSLPPHSLPLADSFVSTARLPDPPPPLVVVFPLAATDRTSPAPLLGLHGFVPAAVPRELSVQRKPHNPAAFPSAHSRR